MAPPGGTTYNWPKLEPMELAFILAGEITQVKEPIPWVRCASGNVYVHGHRDFGNMHRRGYKRVHKSCTKIVYTKGVHEMCTHVLESRKGMCLDLM